MRGDNLKILLNFPEPHQLSRRNHGNDNSLAVSHFSSWGREGIKGLWMSKLIHVLSFVNAYG